MDVKSFFFQGIGNSAKGIAMVGGACRRDGFAVNINSLWTEENSELNTARVWVHELGHQVGIKAIHSYRYVLISIRLGCFMTFLIIMVGQKEHVMGLCITETIHSSVTVAIQILKSGTEEQATNVRIP